MNDIVMHEGRDLVPAQQIGRSVALHPSINAGAVAIEAERAIAEARGQMQLAKMFPRSLAAARADLIEACKSREFAAQAFYTVPNRGSGPSIRFAEEVARVYGNFQYGHRELSRSEGKSEIEVYAWDVENNNRSTRQITVMHVRDKQGGATVLKDQTDIDNRIANVASKQMRGRILALVSKELVATGIAECKKTLAGNNDEPMSARVARITAAFAKLGVTADALAKYIGHSLDDMTIDEVADIQGIFNAIKEGATKPSEYFGAKDEAPAEGTAAAGGAASRIAAAAKSGEKAADKPKATAKAEPEKAPPAAAESRQEPEPPKADAEPQRQPQPAQEPSEEESVF